MPRCTYQYRFDIDSPKKRSEQDAAVHTVDLRRFQRIVKGTDALRENDIARKARIGYGTVAELAFLQDVPKCVYLLVYRTFGRALVAQETIHDAGIQRFTKQLVDHRILFVDVCGKKDTGIVKLRPVRHITQQAFIDATHRKRTYPLSQVFPVHLHFYGYAHRFRLCVILQCLVIPDDIGINSIFRPRLVQHKFRHGTGKERGLGNLYPHPAISSP